MSKYPLRIATVALAATAVAMSTNAFASAPVATVVTIKNIAYHPAIVRIHAGQSVKWVWGDAALDTEHNVTSEGSPHFKSSPTQFTGSYTVKFSTRGTYNYHCTIHTQAMNGKVIVS